MNANEIAELEKSYAKFTVKPKQSVKPIPPVQQEQLEPAKKPPYTKREGKMKVDKK